MNNNITITMPYYDQPKMLEAQIENWKRYPSWGWGHLKLIVVDDGSPNHPAEKVFKINSHPPFPVEVYRIQEDIPWNHGGARNLAFHQADPGWCVLTDMDHMLPLESICSLLTMLLLPDFVYVPARYRKLSLVEREKIHGHSDSFILTRDKFWKIGGFDEHLAGYWNGVSGPFRKALKRCSGTIELDSVYFLMYDENLIPDAHVKSLGRKGSQYDIKKHANSSLWDSYSKALTKYSPKDPLRFNWEQVI
jgi:hypothetical protein